MKIARTTTEMGTFYYPAEDAFIADVLRHGVAWEADVLRAIRAHLPAEGPRDVIDVGAHVGTHTVPYARWVRGHGFVHAFEPHAVMAELLGRNVEANGCADTVEVFPFAAGHVDGAEVSLASAIADGPNAGEAYGYEDGREFNYGGVQLGLGRRKVVMRTLDSFNFADVALLKVDAEGSEALVFWGARELIRRCRPLILFERNDKTINESMRAMIDIPDEVAAFRIEAYTASLGYAAPLEVGPHEHLLRPPPRR